MRMRDPDDEGATGQYNEDEFVSDSDIEYEEEEIIEEFVSTDDDGGELYDEETLDTDGTRELYDTEDDYTDDDGDEMLSRSVDTQSYDSEDTGEMRVPIDPPTSPVKIAQDPLASPSPSKPSSKLLVDELKETLASRQSPYPEAKVVLNDAAKGELLDLQRQEELLAEDAHAIMAETEDEESDVLESNDEYELTDGEETTDDELLVSEDDVRTEDSADDHIEQAAESEPSPQIETQVESTDESFQTDGEETTDDELVVSEDDVPTGESGDDHIVKEGKQATEAEPSAPVDRNDETVADEDFDDNDIAYGDLNDVEERGHTLEVHGVDVPSVSSGSLQTTDSEFEEAKRTAEGDTTSHDDTDEESEANRSTMDEVAGTLGLGAQSVASDVIDASLRSFVTFATDSVDDPGQVLTLPVRNDSKLDLPTLRNPGESELINLVRASNWQSLLKLMEKFRKQDPDFLYYELTKNDYERRATPLHHAVANAPKTLCKLMIALVPFERRRDIMLLSDVDGNTPLHIACLQLGIDEEKGIDDSIVNILALGAPSAHYVKNREGNIPLSLVLSSRAFKSSQDAAKDLYVVEAVADKLVQTALEDHLDLTTVRNDRGRTLLHLVAAFGTHERVLHTLFHKAPKFVRAADNDGRLPIHYLASSICGPNPPLGIASDLVEEFPESLMSTCHTGDTPLHLLLSNLSKNIESEEKQIASGVEKITSLLVGRGDPILVKNNNGLNPLHCGALFAAPANSLRAVVMSENSQTALQMQGPNGATPLHLLCASSTLGNLVEQIDVLGSEEVAEMKDLKGRIPLHVAAENTSATKGSIQKLISMNQNAVTIENEKGRLAAHIAIRKNPNETVVKCLLKANPKAVRCVFDGDNTVFHEMCQYRSPASLIQGLIQLYPEGPSVPNKLNNIPLHIATAYQCDIDTVKTLAQAHPSGCLHQNTQQDTPLHYAASFQKQEEVVQFLVDFSPTAVQIANAAGKTPLDNAAVSGLEEVIKDAAENAKGEGEKVRKSKKKKDHSSQEDDTRSRSSSVDPSSRRRREKSVDRSSRKRDKSVDKAARKREKSVDRSGKKKKTKKKSKSSRGSNTESEEDEFVETPQSRRRELRKSKAALAAELEEAERSLAALKEVEARERLDRVRFSVQDPSEEPPKVRKKVKVKKPKSMSSGLGTEKKVKKPKSMSSGLGVEEKVKKPKSLASGLGIKKKVKKPKSMSSGVGVAEKVKKPKSLASGLGIKKKVKKPKSMASGLGAEEKVKKPKSLASGLGIKKKVKKPKSMASGLGAEEKVKKPKSLASGLGIRKKAKKPKSMSSGLGVEEKVKKPKSLASGLGIKSSKSQKREKKKVPTARVSSSTGVEMEQSFSVEELLMQPDGFDPGSIKKSSSRDSTTGSEAKTAKVKNRRKLKGTKSSSSSNKADAKQARKSTRRLSSPLPPVSPGSLASVNRTPMGKRKSLVQEMVESPLPDSARLQAI